jgi:hypothetical protein
VPGNTPELACNLFHSAYSQIAAISLHRSVSGAKAFYRVYFGIVAAAARVLIPGSPPGLTTKAV